MLDYLKNVLLRDETEQQNANACLQQIGTEWSIFVDISDDDEVFGYII